MVISVPLIVTSKLKGLQCLEIRIPACRLHQSFIKYPISLHMHVGNNLADPILLYGLGYTLNKIFTVVPKYTNITDLVGASLDWLSANVQYLRELKITR